ncbi:MAG: rhodanese-like domain-containing protein [Pseudomonadota bacterium]|nr:rhodanese-like domain-containing protein [Pseudomonadota bacterium]
MTALSKRIHLFGLLLILTSPWTYADYKGELDQTQAQGQLQAGQITAIDVRSPEEYQAGHVPGAINIPHDHIDAELTKIAHLKDKPLLLYCRSGRRAEMAESTLTQLGFTQLYHLQGDMQGWSKNQLPEEN